MVLKKYISKAVLVLLFAVFFGCVPSKASGKAVTESKAIAKNNSSKDLILENSVAMKREAQKRMMEQKKNLMISDYMDSYKGPRAKLEGIPSVEIHDAILKHCAKYRIGPEVLVGLTIKESNLAQKPKDSPANCRGICQISKFALEDFNTNVQWPKYHDKRYFYTWEDMYDYDKNIEVACYYLRWLWDSFSDVRTVEDVLICYNVGHGNLAKYKAKENYGYHKFVIARAQEYQNIVTKFPS